MWSWISLFAGLVGWGLLLLSSCHTVNAWTATWGSMVKEPITKQWEVQIKYAYHTETFAFRFGSSPKYLMDVCMNSFTLYNSSVEECEEFACEAFHSWYKINYVPGLYSPTMYNAVDFMVTRGVVLSALANMYEYKSYLEIGTDQDQIFSQARKRFDVAIGVDPISGGTHRMSSDSFFDLNNQYFDLIFVDGSHEAQQVYVDVINSLRWLNPGGTIVMHDCNPQGVLAMRTSVPPLEGVKMWNGDTWKAVVTLRLLNDIDLVVVDADHGIAVVRRRSNTHPLSAEWKKILGGDPISVLGNDHLRNHRLELLPLMTMMDMEEWLYTESGSLNGEL
jgi:predicted O-methyltransferase YrrM